MPSRTDNRRLTVGLALAVLSVAIFAYSFLIAQQLLLGVSVAVWLLILYLLWRFVRAHERIADALEAENGSE
jgi:tetrahydromethanopterin S-methyltransferase subunit C